MRELLEHLLGLIERDAPIRDALPVDRRAPGHVVLTAFDQVALQHHAENPLGSFSNLFTNRCRHERLAAMILFAVAVRAIDHHALGQSLLASRADTSPTCVASKFGPECFPPRRITWQASLPEVWKIADTPCFVTDGNQCAERAASTASIAVFTLPSVLFLKPTGIDSPEASSRWTWLSVVRAPIATHEVRSAMCCGIWISRNSEPLAAPDR